MKETIKILAIDGGGIRGIIPAIFLHHLDLLLKKLNKSNHLYNNFDLIAGTSTGGLLAIGLNTPLTIENDSRSPKFTPHSMFELYQEKGSSIFQGFGNIVTKNIGVLYRNKYDGTYLEKLAEELYPETKLSQTFKPMVITAFNSESMSPHIFNSHQTDEEDFFIKDVARATAAAPIFFPPAEVHGIGESAKSYSLLDGGMFANNPSLVALSEAKKMFPNSNKFEILSIGTGYFVQGFKYDDIKNWGMYQWMSPKHKFPIVNILQRGQATHINHTLRNLPEVEYNRFNILLNSDNAGLDNTESGNIEYLKEQGLKLVEENEGKMEALIKKLF